MTSYMLRVMAVSQKFWLTSAEGVDGSSEMKIWFDKIDSSL